MKKHTIRWMLLFYDTLLLLLSSFLVLYFYPGGGKLTVYSFVWYTIAGFICLLITRMILKIYRQIWRYAGPATYMSMMAAVYRLPRVHPFARDRAAKYYLRPSRFRVRAQPVPLHFRTADVPMDLPESDKRAESRQNTAVPAQGGYRRFFRFG